MKRKGSKGQLEDLESTIEKYRSKFKSKRALARFLADSGYSKFSLVKALHVSGASFREPQPKGKPKVVSNMTADEAVMKAGRNEAIEQLTQWMTNLQKQQIENIMKVGRVLTEERVEEEATAMGVTPEKYLHLALNFYRRWKGYIMEKILSGEIQLTDDVEVEQTNTLTQSTNQEDDLVGYTLSVYKEAIKFKILIEVMRQMGFFNSNN